MDKLQGEQHEDTPRKELPPLQPEIEIISEKKQ
jgi:hypothetical protein